MILSPHEHTLQANSRPIQRNLDFNDPLYNEVLGTTIDIPGPSNSKIYENRTLIKRNLVIANIFCQSLSPLICYIENMAYWSHTVNYE